MIDAVFYFSSSHFTRRPRIDIAAQARAPDSPLCVTIVESITCIGTVFALLHWYASRVIFDL
ncbi:MAG: hypothetical protein ACRESO_08370, partial [Gammaproteobacteria bacterium]